MENALSGSAERNLKDDFSGPLDIAKEGALKFMFGMQQLSTFKAISERIQLIEALMNLPLLQSGSTTIGANAKEQYTKEMEELGYL